MIRMRPWTFILYSFFMMTIAVWVDRAIHPIVGR